VPHVGFETDFEPCSPGSWPKRLSRSGIIAAARKCRATVFSGSSLFIADVEDAGEIVCVRAWTRDGRWRVRDAAGRPPRVNSYHHRAVADVPIDDRRVLVKARVRRMPCPAMGCNVQACREYVPGVLDIYGEAPEVR
jgi:hypothetical protein